MSDRIKIYSKIKYTLAIVGFVYLLSILLLFQFSGLAVWLRVGLTRLFANQALIIFFYCLIIFSLYFTLTFPIEFYRSYTLEHRFGLSREKFLHWFGDQFKEFFVGFFIFVILVEGFFYFLRHYPENWWWISSLFWIFLSVILARLFPVLIIPLFFKYKRIANEDLRQRILNLANKMGIKILDVFQIDFSKKTEKANAALVGLGKTKRVILADTLQGKFSPEEIEVILAHEFSHFLLRHLIKMLIMNAGLILFIFYFLFKFSDFIFSPFNLDLADIASLNIWIFYFVVLQFCFLPLLNWISRNMERNADYLAVKFTGERFAFISMMEKLSQQNLVERKPSRWIKIFFFDHPPIEERVMLAENYSLGLTPQETVSKIGDSMQIKDCQIKILQADITELKVDAIVNAANNKLVMGGGVAHAIKKKGGKVIEEEAVAKGPIKIGQAIYTQAGGLASKFVIHAATMGMDFVTDETKIRLSCATSLDVAEELKVKSLAFPALGCGVGGFTYIACAKIMTQEIFKHLRQTSDSSLRQIIFCLYNKEAYEVFNHAVIRYLEYITNKIQQGPFVTVDAIIEINKGIVLIKRSNPPFGWALPGGFVDYGESLEEAVRREAKEETGVDLEDLRQFHTYSKPGRDPRFHTISTVYIARGKGKPKSGSDAANLEVVKIKDLKKYNFAFDHKEIIEEYLKYKKR